MDFKQVYTHNAANARERGELDQYRESNRRNTACAEAIDAAVRDSNYELYHYDLAGAAKSIVAGHGPDRVAWVLANVIRRMDYDGRLSRGHKQWAQDQPIPEGYKPDFYLNTHPAILDGFTGYARREIENHLRAAEMSAEQNYNMLDGRINNEPASKADLTDGQTHEEICELAPETLPSESQQEEKPSLLGRLEQIRKNPPEHKPPEHTTPTDPER